MPVGKEKEKGGNRKHQTATGRLGFLLFVLCFKSSIPLFSDSAATEFIVVSPASVFIAVLTFLILIFTSYGKGFFVLIARGAFSRNMAWVLMFKPCIKVTDEHIPLVVASKSDTNGGCSV